VRLNFGRKLLNFYLYSNLHIALAATALTLFSYLGFQSRLDYNYLLFVFSSTLLLYAVHRAIGIRQTKEARKNYRFEIIESYRHHIFLYALIGLTGSVWSFFRFDRDIQLTLILPVILSGLYALPLIGNKRIRDFHYIKIFLVSIIWSWISFAIPYLESDQIDKEFALLFIDRTLFIFAITIPFDIRDIKTDQFNKVKTLVHLIGVNGSKNLSLILLLIASVILVSTIGLDRYSLSLIMTYIIAGLLIKNSAEDKNDIYFTGWIDGTMVIPLLIVGAMDLIKFAS